MSHSQKFQQRWEFRKRDSHFDSSSDEPKSSSSGEPVLKKHMLVSNWMSPKTNETGGTSVFQQKDRLTPGTGGHFEFVKVNKIQTRSSKSGKKEDDPEYNERRERPSYKEVNTRKSKSRSHVAATLNSNRIFMESILEELKVAGEDMLISMREEMRKVMGDDTAVGSTVREGSYEQEIDEVQRQNSFKSGLDVRKCNDGSFVGPVKRKRTNGSRDCYEGLEGQADYCQNIAPMTSTEKENGERLGSSINESTFSTSPSDHVSSSIYLTLPSVLPETHIENLRLNSSSCNNFQEQMAGNRTAVNAGKENPMLDSNIRYGYITAVQQEEKLKNVAHTGSKDLDYFGKKKFSLASSAGTGFPIPLCHGLNGGFKIQSQVGLGNPSQDQNNILGLRMNGEGMRLAGGSHGLSELYVANDISSHLSSKVVSDAWTHGNSIPRSQRGSVVHELFYQG
ncbi:hypothetical protein HHK36_032861 [Tetracentron sinense]|uniref:Uncharacterized protein n=1 Tax=Tetracentron sinense TaxID=13715 RepID=A0A835CX79_TETSI|nr:hypothetical protein HHK36_032861 [Tetracentron sinense]